MNFQFPISNFQLQPGLSARGTQLAIGNRQLAIGFTLVELIISIGLVLIIMLGINFVFKMTSDTITTGQSLNEAIRNNRAAQSVLLDDFSKMAPDGPALLLRSQAIRAFRNRADQDADTDYAEGNTLAQRQAAIETFDIDGDGAFTSIGEVAHPARPGQRSHRTDILSFFAKGKFRRATGGDVGRNIDNDPAKDPTAPLVSDMTANEAWVWYGHLVLPDNNGSFDISIPGVSGGMGRSNPGVGLASTNQNNFFASQWTLGRLAHLLVEPYDNTPTGTGPRVIVDRAGSAGVPQVFIGRSSSVSTNSRAPIDWQSGAYPDDASPSVERAGVGLTLRDSRFDLMGTTIAGYRSILNNIDQNVARLDSFDWYSTMMLSVRFETNPALVRPVTASTIAAQAPIFMPGTTQFIVEYAGDFLAQNNDPTSGNFGQVTDAFIDSAGNASQTDGQVDFVVQWQDTNNNGLVDVGEAHTARKAVRWYGFPRDTDGDGVVTGFPGSGNRANRMKDVVPLRDLLATIGVPEAPFEKDMNLATGLPARANYLDPTNGAEFDNRYTCAWGPNDTVRPKMIRLTIVVDDPTGRLPDGQTYEYVFNVPAGE